LGKFESGLIRGNMDADMYGIETVYEDDSLHDLRTGPVVLQGEAIDSEPVNIQPVHHDQPLRPSRHPPQPVNVGMGDVDRNNDDGVGIGPLDEPAGAGVNAQAPAEP
jgi:hypothetical protein